MSGKVAKGKNQGFTMVEMLLAVVVAAGMITISFPNIIDFLRIQDQKREEVRLLEIRKALEAFAKANLTLPPEASWDTDIAGFTELSVAEIQTDVWGRPHQYRLLDDDPTVFLGGIVLDIDYAVLFSYGETGEIDPTTILGGLFPGSANPADPLDPLVSTLDYRDVRVGDEGDDKIVKYSTLHLMANNLNVTVERLNNIRDALADYSDSYMSAAAIASQPVSGTTFSPPSDVPAAPLVPDLGTYDATVQAETTNFLADRPGPPTRYMNAPGNDTERREHMVRLMRQIGLPDEHCCSLVEIGGDGLPEPFFYYSNPRPLLTLGGCGARPRGSTLPLLTPPEPYLPARVELFQPVAPDNNCG